MGFFKRLLGLEQRAITYQQGVTCGLVSGPTYSGMPVNELTALGAPSFLCGVRVIGEAVGSLPIKIYRTKRDKSIIADDEHPLHEVFREPNPEITRPVFFETLMAHCLIYGNGFAEIRRRGDGSVAELWNVHPTRVRVGRDAETGRLEYKVMNSPSAGPPGTPGQESTIQQEDMIHVLGLSPDGTLGYRIIQVCREAIGFGLAAQRYGCSLFNNMGRPGGVIDIAPGQKLDDTGRENLKRSFRQDTTGSQVGSIVVMEQGNKFTPLTFSTNEQMQYKELVQFFVYEVARILNISPTKLHSLEKATWANLKELNQDFYNTTLRPWLEKQEAELERKLLLPSEKGKIEIEFDAAEYLRTDQPTRYEAYKVAVETGWLTVDEVRTIEGYPPLPEPKPTPIPPPPPMAQDQQQQQQQQEGTAANG